MVQGLGLSAFTARGLGSAHAQGTKILQALWHGQKKKFFFLIKPQTHRYREYTGGCQRQRVTWVKEAKRSIVRAGSGPGGLSATWTCPSHAARPPSTLPNLPESLYRGCRVELRADL